jgi:hypothetical protein
MSQGVEVGQMEIRYRAEGAQAGGLWLFELQVRAQSLRAEVLARAVGVPWRWLRTRVAQLRAPIDFEPVEF